jgi:dihydropteroate synthase
MGDKLKFFTQKEDIKEIIAANYDPIAEWVQDKKGYFLIRINKDKKRLEAGFTTNKHIITKIIHGKNSIDVVNTLIREKLITRLDHAAYLGKELYKAEIALRYGLEYKQDFPLTIIKIKEKVKIKDNS